MCLILNSFSSRISGHSASQISGNETGYPANETLNPANETEYPENETRYPAGYRISGTTLLSIQGHLVLPGLLTDLRERS